MQAIEAKRASVKLGDDELRVLLTEVNKGRDEREEFLESIDRIITELKNYTEHSTAFLSKVSKRDAPDYYDGELIQCFLAPLFPSTVLSLLTLILLCIGGFRDAQ